VPGKTLSREARINVLFASCILVQENEKERSLKTMFVLAMMCAASVLWGQPESVTVQGGAFKLYGQVYKSESLTKSPSLVVVLHGDAPNNAPGYQYGFASRAADFHQDVIAVALLRPGYVDPNGNRSDGVRGITNGDNWHAENTDALAEAIAKLAKRFKSRETFVVGHSGGAALTANMLGRHPKLINGAVLVSLPGDVHKWRKHMLEQFRYPVFSGNIETLNAIDQLPDVDDKTLIRIVVGNLDEITPPSLSELYFKRAQELQKKASINLLIGKGHEILFEPAVIAELSELLGQ
jgi:pimeloyl-ACP methyl ester carboxylesterase